MTIRVKWLGKGHIPHGYRRVFVVYENDELRHIVNFMQMPYEAVFHVQEMSGEHKVKDPALWWGLSLMVRMLSDGTLLNKENLDVPDDGFMQVRPQPLTENELIPVHAFEDIAKNGEFVFSE